MSDCRFGVSPVNNPDPGSRGGSFEPPEPPLDPPLLFNRDITNQHLEKHFYIVLSGIDLDVMEIICII